MNKWFRICGALREDNLVTNNYVSELEARVWREMSVLVKKKRGDELIIAERVLECWKYYRANLYRWDKTSGWKEFTKMN